MNTRHCFFDGVATLLPERRHPSTGRNPAKKKKVLTISVTTGELVKQCGNILAKAAALRIILNIDDAPVGV
jgi:hypothetical protein